jgi:hypothetical protein
MQEPLSADLGMNGLAQDDPIMKQLRIHVRNFGRDNHNALSNPSKKAGPSTILGEDRVGWQTGRIDPILGGK